MTLRKFAGCFVALILIVGFAHNFGTKLSSETTKQQPQRSIASTISDKTEQEIAKCYSHFNMNASEENTDFEPATDDSCIDMNVDLANNE
jgi:hypothetical protein